MHIATGFQPVVSEQGSESKEPAQARVHPDSLPATSISLMPNQTQDDRIFRLLDLPSELQLIIIRFAAVHDDFVQVTGLLRPKGKSDEKRWAGHNNQLRYPPALARVSQLFRRETLSAFYRHNTFRGELCAAEGKPELLTWLRNIGSARTAVVELFVECGKAETDGYDVEKCAFRLRTKLDAEAFGAYELSRVEGVTFKLVFHA